ncbi:serine hydrolase domain-containing protein [Symbioplanes lichenis]|uniref:serine hydrolase domain-containing protein n=1 Tax=Symbioplanes lichenis TaxID=1629072 RepID=UPI00273A0834|nr:serine hydrolase domain-containing protein [Actinoplanes lichenis]
MRIAGEVFYQRGDEVIVGRESPLRHQIASISKQFTAAAVLLLAQDGKLTPEDPLDRWFPGWPGVTLHHLLSHTSGIAHWADHPELDLRVSPPDFVELARGWPVITAPGTEFRYSSPGYVLLAHVVQEVAGEPFRDFLTRRVFGAAGLVRTFSGLPGDRTDVAAGHDAQGNAVPSWDLDGLGLGTGDIWSTTAELITWMDRLHEGAVIGEPWRTLMLTRRVATGGDDFGSGYGYGVFTGTWHGEPWIQHSGDNAGYKSFAAILPESRRRVAVLTDSDALVGEHLQTLLERLLRA